MEVNIFKVHRAGKVYFAAYVNGSYLERASKADLEDVIKVRNNFANIFADPLAFSSKAGLQ
jgi:hypothetical protein